MNKKHLLSLFITGFLFQGCDAQHADQEGLGDRQQAGLGWNGLGWNGLGWNGLGWNGLGWNGLGWNGTSFVNTLPGTMWGADWGLDAYINNRDADGSGGPLTSDDRQAALDAMAYWVQCVCGPSDNLPWTGNNPYPTPHTETLSFQGAFNLAPNWCHGTGAVPNDELQMVSACLFSRINSRGIHNALSLRGYDSSLALGDNEKLFMAYPEAMFWGNIWDDSPSMSFAPDWYENTRAYTCHYPWGAGNMSLAHDLGLITGRDCPWTGCGNHMKTSLACLQPGTADGSNWMAYSDSALTAPLGLSYDPAIATPAIGPNNSTANGYQDNLTGAKYVTWRGRQFRQISTYMGAWADLEPENWKPAGYKCSDGCAPTDGCGCYKSYCQVEGGPLLCEQPSECNNCGSVVFDPGPRCGTSDVCLPSDECVRGRKLTSLACWLQINFMRPFDILTSSWVTGNANVHKAGTLVFRYSNGTDKPAGIMIRDNIRGGAPIAGGAFNPTGGWDNYQLQMIYPVYPGRAVFSAGVPGIDLSIKEDPTQVFPHLDYAQIFVGPPFGTPPREQYDDGLGTTQTIPESGAQSYIKTLVAIDKTTSLLHPTRIRIRPVVKHPQPSELKYVIVHGKSQTTIPGTAIDESGYTKWNEGFNAESTAGSWEVRVYGSLGKPVGTFSGVVLEVE